MKQVTGLLLLLLQLASIISAEGYLRTGDHHPRRSLADIEYRVYMQGDTMPGENFNRCQSHLCYVAVDVATSKNTVIGIIRTVIPDKNIDEDLDHLIREKIPKADKKGEIGYVELVEVLEDWRRKGVATALINHTFKYIGMKMPKVVAMYLIVNPLSKGAVELYKKTKFQFIIKDGICDIYARYDFT